jgi:hypothetical protein
MFKSYFREKDDENNRHCPKDDGVEDISDETHRVKRCKCDNGSKPLEDQEEVVGREDVGVGGTHK